MQKCKRSGNTVLRQLRQSIHTQFLEIDASTSRTAATKIIYIRSILLAVSVTSQRYYESCKGRKRTGASTSGCAMLGTYQARMDVHILSGQILTMMEIRFGRSRNGKWKMSMDNVSK